MVIVPKFMYASFLFQYPIVRKREHFFFPFLKFFLLNMGIEWMLAKITK